MSPHKDKIEVPKLHAGFYSAALEEINDKLKSDPENDRLVDQKIFYCEQLNWPTTCISALDAQKEMFGMSNQLVRQYMAYYQIHDHFRALLDLFDSWDEEYGIKTEYPSLYIDCLVKSRKQNRAKRELRSYLISNQSADDLAFASSKYLMLDDTAMAVYNLSKLYKLNPNDELMWEYGMLLIKLGYNDLGVAVLKDYTQNYPLQFDRKLVYASVLRGIDKKQEARNILMAELDKDTATYLVADLYVEDQQWDSAALILERLIERDSSDRKALWRIGRLYEDRGWLLYAMRYLEQLEELHPDDTLASQRIELIQRKIAYLQRLKFEENKIPALELEPKKIEN